MSQSSVRFNENFQPHHTPEHNAEPALPIGQKMDFTVTAVKDDRYEQPFREVLRSRLDLLKPGAAASTVILASATVTWKKKRPTLIEVGPVLLTSKSNDAPDSPGATYTMVG